MKVLLLLIAALLVGSVLAANVNLAALSPANATGATVAKAAQQSGNPTTFYQSYALTGKTQSCTTGATIKCTSFPPSFGADVGPAFFSYSASKFSWANGNSNMTQALPSLTIAVAGIGCAVAQSASFSHNSTTYIWSFSGASACNGVAITTVMHFYVKNGTTYNQKEVVITGTTTRAGAVKAVVNSVSFPLGFGTCSSTCTSLQSGSVGYDWSALASFTRSFNNQTHTLSVSSGSSSAAITTYRFDPTALDGGVIAHNTSGTSLACTLTTANTNDIIFVAANVKEGTDVDLSSVSDNSSLGWNDRAHVQIAATTQFVAHWYAVSSGTLSSDVITANWGHSGTYNSIICFGISGANTAAGSIFDGHAGIPGTANTGGIPAISTSNANDFIFGSGITGGIAPLPGSGWTMVCGVTCNYFYAAEYRVVSATQTSLAYTLISDSFNYGINEAVCQSGSSCGSVTQPIKITLQEAGAPTETLTITNCHPSPSTIVDDGSAHNIAVDPSCSSLTVTATSGIVSRYEFKQGSSVVATSTWVLPNTCASGTCTERDNSTYFQTENTWNAIPYYLPTVWDGIYAVAMHGTYLGSANFSDTNGISTSNGGGSVTTTFYFDYNTQVCLTHPIGTSWNAVAPYCETVNGSNHSYNVNYIQSSGTTTTTTTTTTVTSTTTQNLSGPQGFSLLLIVAIVIGFMTIGLGVALKRR